MNRSGFQMVVVLKDVHLNWGTKSRDGMRKRDPYEAYIPIPAKEAKRLQLYRGTSFRVLGTSFEIMASGSQGDVDHGKNFHSKGDLKLLGQYLKNTLKAQPGDKVIINWVNDSEVSITIS